MNRINSYMTNINLRIVLRLFMGIMFLFSGISKLFPIEAFESVTVQQGIISWELVPYLSRILIAFEILLGLLFVLSVKIRRFTVPASLVMLGAFTVYLLYLEITGAGGDNCGCFGELLPMSGISSIIKNLVFAAVALYLLKLTEAESRYSYAHIGAGYVVVLSILLVATPVKHYETVTELQPVPAPATVAPDNQEHSITMPDDTVKNAEPPAKLEADTAKKEIKKPLLGDKYPVVVSVYSELIPGIDSGIRIVAFFSLDCDHCLAVATEMNKNTGAISVAKRHYLFLGSEDQIEPFFAGSGGSVGHTLLTPQKFYPHLSAAPPKVILLVNGNPVLVMEGDAVSVKVLIDKIKEINQNYSIK